MIAIRSKKELDEYYSQLNFNLPSVRGDLLDLSGYTGLYCPGNQFYYIVDYVSHEIILTGGALEQVLGYETDEFTMGVLLEEAIHPDHYEDIVYLSAWSHELAIKYSSDWGGKNHGFLLNASYKMKKKNGRDIFVVRTTEILSSDPNGNVVHGISFVTDLTGNLGLNQDTVTAFVMSPYGEYLHFANNVSDQLLTPAERKILNALYHGDSSQKIADRLHLSKHTVDTHRRRILKKLGAKSTTEAINKAFRTRLV